MKYIGSFSGHLIARPQMKLDYQATQQVTLFVEQNGQTLHSIIINDIDHIVGKKFDVEFTYIDTTNQISLCIESYNKDDQFNRDISVELVQLEIDRLFKCKHLLFQAILQTTDGKIFPQTNTLWCTGQLINKFDLPIVSQVIPSTTL